MTTTTTTTLPVAETPRQIVERLRKKQGRTLNYLADKTGVSPSVLNSMLIGRSGYRFRPEQRERLADALGVPVDIIWRELAPAVPTVPPDGEREQQQREQQES